MACPSAQLCLIAGADGVLYTSTDFVTWTATASGMVLGDLSCASLTLCVGVGDNREYAPREVPRIVPALQL